jgi:hypothetical protein
MKKNEEIPKVEPIIVIKFYKQEGWTEFYFNANSVETLCKQYKERFISAEDLYGRWIQIDLSQPEFVFTEMFGKAMMVENSPYISVKEICKQLNKEKERK